MGRKKASHPKRYRDEDTLRRLYVEEGLTSREVAERLDCSQPTVVNWLKKHEISVTTPTSDRPPYYGTSTQGYEYWQTSVGDRERKTVRVHRLTAVAWFGWDAVTGGEDAASRVDVHHRNSVPWDNREVNLKLIPHGEHMSMHNIEQHNRGCFD